MTTIKDNRIGNAILRKMAKESNFDINNVWLNEWYKYVQTVNCNLKDADFCQTEYKGKTYKVQYLSGCFNPYICEVN